MQKITLLLSMLALTAASFATVRTVSNRNPQVGQFSDVGAAITASADGDTVYVHGSPITYGSITVDKKLTIIGPGFEVPNTDALTALFVEITFPGMAYGGATIMGLKVSNIKFTGSGNSGVYIVRNQITDRITFVAPGQNHNTITIDGNVFTSATESIDFGNREHTSMVTVKNNVFNGGIINLPTSAALTNLFSNNLHLKNGQCLNNFNNATFQNNIFHRANPMPGIANCTFINNITFEVGGNPAFPNGVNLQGVDPQFVSVPVGGALYSSSSDYHLQPGSPAINAGTDGMDIGIYGGSGHYNQGGIPNIPQLRSFSVNGSTDVAPGATISVNVTGTIKP